MPKLTFFHIDEDSQSEWEAFVKKHTTSGFLQSFFWSDFKRSIGWETYKIGMKKDGELIGGAVIMKFHFSKTKNFLYIPEGPVLDYKSPDAEEIFHALISEIDAVANLTGDDLTTHLRIEPRLSGDNVPTFFKKFRKAPYNMEPRHTRMLNLDVSEEELLAKMKPKGRYNIKIAQREKVSVRTVELHKKTAELFMEVYEPTTERNKFEGKNLKYFQRLFEHLHATQSGALFIAEYNKKILAAALVILYGNRVTYFFGGSSNKDRNKMAPYLLHWEIARYAKAHVYKWYDFWGVAPPNAKDHGWKGLTQFKEKFGGEFFEYTGAYDFIYNKKLYAEFLKESGEV